MWHHSTERRCAFQSVNDETRISWNEYAYVLTARADEEVVRHEVLERHWRGLTSHEEKAAVVSCTCKDAV